MITAVIVIGAWELFNTALLLLAARAGIVRVTVTRPAQRKEAGNG